MTSLMARVKLRKRLSFQGAFLTSQSASLSRYETTDESYSTFDN